MVAVDYELEYLDSLFEAEDVAAIQRWQAIFAHTLENWQADRTRQMLRQIKTRPLSPQQESLVRHMEGMFLVRIGDWENARKAYERALAIRRNLGDRYGQLVLLNSLANLFRRGGLPLPEALQLYQQAEQVARDLKAEDSRIEILLGMGITYFALGNFEQAVECLNQVLPFAKSGVCRPVIPNDVGQGIRNKSATDSGACRPLFKTNRNRWPTSLGILQAKE